MGYLYLLIATMSWSLVGVLVKTASFQFDFYTITFARFFIGVLALGVLVVATRNTLRPKLLGKWIWIGALAKAANYLFENLGVSAGYAYGNVLVYPVQTLCLMLFGIFLFKEKMSMRGWFASAIVITGALLITWNGRPLASLWSDQGWLSIIFVLSGIGAAAHLLSQKMLLDSMNDVSMNFSIFFWASLITALPLPIAADWTPEPLPGSWLAAVGLGLITGLSFVFSSKAMRTVKFSVTAIATNLPVLFTVFWAALFFREPITGYITCGAIIVVIGMTMLNWPVRKEKDQSDSMAVGTR